MEYLNNKKKDHLVFVAISLVGGGAEHVLVSLIRSLYATNEYNISLVLFNNKGIYAASIPTAIKIFDLKKGGSLSFPLLIIKLLKLFKKIKPTKVISFLNYTNTVVAFARLFSFGRFCIIQNVRICISQAYTNSFVHLVQVKLLFFALHQSDLIIVNSDGIRRDLLSLSGSLAKKKIIVINNPVDIKTIENLKKEQIDKNLTKYVLAVGRLTYQKGYEYLLRAFALIKDKINENLIILGEGELKRKLFSLASDLGISERVIFMGYQANPYKYMANAKAFVLSSLYEGFPNVILEAMVCGAPIIAFDCPAGPNEIIQDGFDGFLVPPRNVAKLADRISGIIIDEKLRSLFISRARLNVERYESSIIVNKFKVAIEQTYFK